MIEPFLCTMRLSRRIYPYLPGHSLAELARSLSLPTAGKAHRALPDAELTAELLLQIMREINLMQPGLALTSPLLRQLMHVPVNQLRTQLERLCA